MKKRSPKNHSMIWAILFMTVTVNISHALAEGDFKNNKDLEQRLRSLRQEIVSTQWEYRAEQAIQEYNLLKNSLIPNESSPLRINLHELVRLATVW